MEPVVLLPLNGVEMDAWVGPLGSSHDVIAGTGATILVTFTTKLFTTYFNIGCQFLKSLYFFAKTGKKR